MKYIQQLDMSDCGAACLAMIASHYGSALSIADVREQAGTDIIGTNVKGLVDAAHSYGLKAVPVKGDAEALEPSLAVPFIAHLHMDKGEGTWADHYVVIKKITERHITVWDPDPLEGKKRVLREEFLKDWTGYAVFLEPEAGFSRKEKKDSLLLKFLPVFLPHKKLLVYSFLSSLLLLAFGLISSFYYKYVFDEVIFAGASFSLASLSVGMLAVVVIQGIVSLIRSVLLSHFSFKSDLQLNFSYLAHILRLPLSFFESRKSGEILSRMGDLDKIKQTLSNAALSGVMDVVMLLASGPVLLCISGRLFGISIATVLLVSAVSAIFARAYRSYYGRSMSEGAEVQSYLYETLNGAATVKALNAEQLVEREYERRRMKAVATGWKVNGLSITQSLISTLIEGISGILVFWLGCGSIINGSLTLGTLITFNSLLGYFTGPLFRLVNIQNGVQEALVAARRVGEILELEREDSEGRELIVPERLSGHVVLEDVTFAYGSRRPVYEHLSLEIPAGSWTAFVGASGSGKSTLVKLLLKFYTADKGRVLLDGSDIRDIDTHALRSKIGYVPQEIFLFSGTVRENIALHCPDATLEHVIEAAKKAGAHGFIEKLPRRYDTVLGEHGGGLSGGERQRLALARALLGNPSMLILDEATSSLDTVSEAEIHRVIRGLRDGGMSVILIAHRLTTVTGCDRIFVMDGGRVVQGGSHRQLLEQDGMYRELWGGIAV